MFWRKATAAGALAAAIGSAILSFIFKIAWPELPFMDRVGLVFLLCAMIAIAISIALGNREQPGSVELAEIDFSTTRNFNVAGTAVALILAALYATWW
jgi:SSS family solute:Na+ symporter